MGTDAIAHLSADRNALIHLFSAYDRLVAADGTDDEREELAWVICSQANACIERDGDLLAVSEADRADVRDLIEQVSTMSPEESFYDAWVALLGCCMRQLIDRNQTENLANLDPRNVRSNEGIHRGSLDS